MARSPRWRPFRSIPLLHVYGSEPSLAPIQEYPWSPEEMRVALHPVTAGQTWEMGPYRVTALRARHTEELQPLCFVVQQDSHALLYATDTGAFYPEAWETLAWLRDEGVRLDVAVIEGTMGLREQAPESGHMNLDRCIDHHRLLRERGFASATCRHLATHFSPNGTPLHEETEAYLAPHGVSAAYDGLQLQVP